MSAQTETPAVKLPPIPVTVVAGFLGSGKTTLLNHILTAEHGRRLGVLVNDFGSINIDAELVTEVGDGMVSLANGCICCSIRMDLIRAVLEMADRPDRPEHIVIESSGVADPAGVVKSFLEPGIWGTVQLDGVITVVDAEQSLELPDQEARLARAQVAGGDIILLNKVDLVDAQTLARVHDWIDTVRPGVQVFETTQCKLPMEILLGVGAMDSDRAVSSPEIGVHVHDVSATAVKGGHGQHDEHDHHHDLLFETWAFTSTTPMHLELVQQVLSHLPSTVFRAKGFVQSVEEPQSRMVLQLVGRRATISPTAWRMDETPMTRLVLIARHGTCNFEAIGKALTACQSEKVIS